MKKIILFSLLFSGCVQKTPPCEIDGRYELVGSDPVFSGLAEGMATRIMDASKFLDISRGSVLIGERGLARLDFRGKKDQTGFYTVDLFSPPDLQLDFDCNTRKPVLHDQIILTPIHLHYTAQ